MRPRVIVALAVVGLFVFLGQGFTQEQGEVAGEFRIEGYGDLEYAIKGKIAKQFDEKITEIKLMCPVEKYNFSFIVEGYADITGTKARNDDIAEKRANTAGSYLRGFFPKSDVASVSRGDEKNIKMVRVKWEATRKPDSSPLTVVTEKKPERTIPWLVVVVIFVSVIGGGVYLMLTNRKGKGRELAIVDKQALPQRKAIVSTGASPEGWQLVELLNEVGQIIGRYEYRKDIVELRDGKFLMPFFHVDEKGMVTSKRIWKDSSSRARGMLTQCLRQPKYSSQVEALLKAEEPKLRRIQ